MCLAYKPILKWFLSLKKYSGSGLLQLAAGKGDAGFHQFAGAVAVAHVAAVAQARCRRHGLAQPEHFADALLRHVADGVLVRGVVVAVEVVAGR
jgi:hypothetical protein